MTRKALIVTIDNDVMATIEDTLDSLGHSFDRAHSKREALKLAAEGEYAYIFIDIEIPANRKGARPERVHGYHLLETLNSQGVCKTTPVVIMDGDPHCLDYVFDYVRKGAVRFAGKAPTDSRRLARAVRETLKEWAKRTRRESRSDQPATFEGGELVIFPDRAELLGVRIMADRGDGHSLRILRALSRRKGSHFVRLALNELMTETEICSQGSVTGCIRKLRRNCSERLLRDLNVLCGLDDVIIRNEQGYQFAPSITVRIVDDRPADSRGTAETSSDTADVPANVTGDISDVPAVGTALSLNERQQWALSEIGRGVPLQRSMLESAFDVSDRTAKRDLLELRRAGLIAWVRDGSTGFYQLAESAEAAA